MVKHNRNRGKRLHQVLKISMGKIGIFGVMGGRYKDKGDLGSDEGAIRLIPSPPD